MRKLQFKKLLNILDAIELQGVALHDASMLAYEKFADEHDALKLHEVQSAMTFLKEKHMLKISQQGIDLNPAPTVFAKSNQNSEIEALSLFESFINDSNIFHYYREQLQGNPFRQKTEVLAYVDKESLQLLLQTTLLEVVEGMIRFRPRLLKGISDILMEYCDGSMLFISTTLTSLYTSSIVAHEDMRIAYKNTTCSMIDYRYKQIIQSILPRRGIPRDRDETKALQAFYKDTLFHEFNHCCPICGISIPHMLIASHIKPFRDCAHIYEAVDHNNGLLLCRNHDYLFDQGYFTFDDTGCIILSEDLLAFDNLNSSYALHKNYHLPDIYLSENRLKFLAYHREVIFRRPM